jgi:DNA-binding response OmpR family regulator
MHALIIEDEYLIAMTIEYVLRDCGFDSFDIAPSSDAALKLAAKRCPDLITADVRLNPGCGIQTVREICQRPSTPVIFITGSAAEARARLPQHAVLNKPFSQQTLTYTVAAVLA